MSERWRAARWLYRTLRVPRARFVWHEVRLRQARGLLTTTNGVRLHTDPADPRAVYLRWRRGELDRDAVMLWRRLVLEVRPSVVIDVGANYGEVGLGAQYGAETRELHLVEANPPVAALLARTVEGLPNGFPTTIVHPCAASRTRGTAQLNVPPVSSGLASLEGVGEHTVTVPVARIDELVQVGPADRILFKVDVEGHEQGVLEGFGGLLETSVGLCEIEHASSELIEFLHDRFLVSLVDAQLIEHPSDPGRLSALLGERLRGHAKEVVLRPRSS